MNTVAKSIVSNKLSSLGRNIGLEDDNKDNKDDTPLSSKELRKIQEKEAAEKAKREQKYAKRNAEREKKREDIRAKYGLQKDDQKGQSLSRKGSSPAEETKSEKDEEKQCRLM
ncbi:complexin-2 [Exaiptasia diaphana]|uniref:Uncharacterized protein n=1 Tax=Exaiptasia diaphana TaxID=2652724 RepID=A0A913X506_EXADI|nr:complexin-2 [Exaiptasia diaphana]